MLTATLSALLIGCGKSPQQDWSERFTHLWQGYQRQFISPEGRVIDPAHSDQRSTSEGQAYAMFFALVANDPSRFDQLLTWTQQNLAQGNLGAHLPAWLWGRRTDDTWGVIDPNTASDADVWIAYTLLQAGRLWHRPAYTEIGRRLTSLITQREVLSIPGVGVLLLPGVQGFGPDTHGCVTINPSYTPLPVAEFMAREFGPPWQSIGMHLPLMIDATASRGFVADWAKACPNRGISIPAAGRPPIGSYDAIRVYLWAGLSAPHTPGQKPLIDSLWGMANYLTAHDALPERVDLSSGAVENRGPIGFSAALLPYLKSQHMQRRFTQQAARVKAAQQPSGLLGKPATYYDQNLALFAIGYLADLYKFDEHGILEVYWQ